MRPTRRYAHGSRHAMVEHQGCRWLESVDGMADEAGYPSPLLRHPASSDPREGGTFSRHAGDGLPSPWTTLPGIASELAGPLPQRIQPSTPPSTTGEEDSSHWLAPAATALPAQPP